TINSYEREAKTSLIYLIGVDILDLSKVKELLLPYLEENSLVFYSVELVKEADALILRVCIDKDGGIDIDSLAACNEYLSERLDSIDQDMPEYFLEVSSPGAEKELRSLDEVIKNVGSFVHIEVPNMIYEGNLLAVEGEDLVLRFNAKGRFKTIHIPYKEINFIRLAVKL
ncbi:MAG: hypothetical protein K2J93_03670, partial [Anaeroplasmataceae bacterium]|nr:hypothetical protein [Anaeroplasmataceae bacterium]